MRDQYRIADMEYDVGRNHRNRASSADKAAAKKAQQEGGPEEGAAAVSAGAE